MFAVHGNGVSLHSSDMIYFWGGGVYLYTMEAQLNQFTGQIRSRLSVRNWQMNISSRDGLITKIFFEVLVCLQHWNNRRSLHLWFLLLAFQSWYQSWGGTETLVPSLFLNPSWISFGHAMNINVKFWPSWFRTYCDSLLRQANHWAFLHLTYELSLSGNQLSKEKMWYDTLAWNPWQLLEIWPGCSISVTGEWGVGGHRMLTSANGCSQWSCFDSLYCF